MVPIVANYATQAFAAKGATVDIFVEAGAKRDTVTDAATIALWSANFTATAPVAGAGNITGIMAGYLATYPAGPQVS